MNERETIFIIILDMSNVAGVRLYVACVEIGNKKPTIFLLPSVRCS